MNFNKHFIHSIIRLYRIQLNIKIENGEKYETH